LDSGAGAGCEAVASAQRGRFEATAFRL